MCEVSNFNISSEQINDHTMKYALNVIAFIVDHKFSPMKKQINSHFIKIVC